MGWAGDKKTLATLLSYLPVNRRRLPCPRRPPGAHSPLAPPCTPCSTALAAACALPLDRVPASTVPPEPCSDGEQAGEQAGQQTESDAGLHPALPKLHAQAGMACQHSSPPHKPHQRQRGGGGVGICTILGHGQRDRLRELRRRACGSQGGGQGSAVHQAPAGCAMQAGSCQPGLAREPCAPARLRWRTAWWRRPRRQSCLRGRGARGRVLGAASGGTNWVARLRSH